MLNQLKDLIRPVDTAELPKSPGKPKQHNSGSRSPVSDNITSDQITSPISDVSKEEATILAALTALPSNALDRMIRILSQSGFQSPFTEPHVAETGSEASIGGDRENKTKDRTS